VYQDVIISVKQSINIWGCFCNWYKSRKFFRHYFSCFLSLASLLHPFWDSTW